MRRVHFTTDGYQFVDADGLVTSHSIKHNELFRFIEQDDSPLYDLLPLYIQECVSIESNVPRRSNVAPSLYKKMLTLLRKLHPICDSEYLDHEIAKYFNECLLKRSNEQAISSDDYILSESDYKKLFDALFPHGYSIEISAGDTTSYHHYGYYTQYRSHLDEPSFLPYAGIPFADIRKSKDFVPLFVYWVLDAEATPFMALSRSQRFEVFNHYHLITDSKLASVEVEYYLGNDKKLLLNGELRHNGTAEDDQEFESMLRVLSSNRAFENLDSEIEARIEGSIKKAIRQKSNNAYCAIYNIKDLFSLLFIECRRLFESNTQVRRCQNCGLYFIGDQKLSRYCDRPVADGAARTCKEIGSAMLQQRKIEQDPVAKVYMRAYKTHNARISKGAMTKQAFQDWVTEAKRRKDAVASNPLLFDEFKEWLKI